MVLLQMQNSLNMYFIRARTHKHTLDPGTGMSKKVVIYFNDFKSPLFTVDVIF